jgi:hypothetical protein
MKISVNTKIIAVPFICTIVLITFSGCSTFIGSRYQKSEMMTHYTAGRYNKAHKDAAEYLERREGTIDELMWLLECGYIEFLLEDFRGSLNKFERAEQIIIDHEQRAVINLRGIASEVGAAYTNQNALPYKGYYYEKIMVHIFKALNYLALDEPEAAQVELRRMRDRQKIIEYEFDEDIYQKAPQQIRMGPNAVISSDSYAKNQTVLEDKRILEEFSNKSLGLFLNPAALYLSAIAYLAEKDYGEAFIDLKKMYQTDKKNPFVRRLYKTALVRLGNEVPQGLKSVKPYEFKLANSCVYVIFENGLTPARDERIIHLVLPPPVGYTGFAYPVLEYYPEYIKNVTVSNSIGRKLTETTSIADMDGIVSMNLKKEFNKIISRAMVSMATKEATSIGLQIAAEQVPYVGVPLRWGIFAAASIYKYASNRADTRCWQTLPKEYQATVFPQPQDGIVTFSLQNDLGKNVESASVNLGSTPGLFLVYLKSNGFSSFSIKVFRMK